MRAALALAGFALSASIVAQTTVSFERKFKEGEKDNYHVALAMTMGVGALDVKYRLEQLVRELLENGDANIVNTISDFKVEFGGQAVPANAPAAVMQRLTRFGLPVDVKVAGSSGVDVSFLRYAFAVYDKPLKLGEPVDVSYDDPAKPGSGIKGKLKLESIEKSGARVRGNFEVHVNGSTLKMATNSLIDIATSKMLKVEGTVSGMQPIGGMQVDACQFTISKLQADSRESAGSITEAAAMQCQATTQKGERCKNKAMKGSNFCWRHQKGKTYGS